MWRALQWDQPFELGGWALTWNLTGPRKFVRATCPSGPPVAALSPNGRAISTHNTTSFDCRRHLQPVGRDRRARNLAKRDGRNLSPISGSQLGEGVRRYGRQRRRRLRLDEFFFEGSVGPGSVEKTVLLLAAELSGRPAGARRADNRRGTRSFWPLKRGFVRYEGQPAGHREFPRSALPCL
jgi:hypothetical protein